MNDTMMHGPQESFPGQLQHWSLTDHTLTCECDNQVVLRVHILSDYILRFRFAVGGFFPPDFSYAIDPAYQDSPSQLTVSEQEDGLVLRTGALVCHLSRQGLNTRVTDTSGNVLLADDKGFHWEESDYGGEIVMMSKQAYAGEAYFGLGDKAHPLNLRGHRLQNWNTDCFGYHSYSDPLYRSIPFYFGLREERAYGVFFDNSFRTFFDFASERDDATSFWSHGGEMNYYVIAGPALLQVAERYAMLTGRAELPPRWSLGYHQCKWSYYPETVVKDLARNFREQQIPCDAIYLDIDYMDAYRCFTWNQDHFPDPKGLVDELSAQGFRTVVIIDPGIKIDPDYWVYHEGLEQDAYLKRLDGPYAKGKVWPGQCYFPDFTKPSVREWWSSLFRDLIRKIGVDGVWNDMNEPAAFEVETKTLPMDIMFDYDGQPASHRKAHNVYGMQMSRASYEGVKHFAYPNRPFMITRASYAGGQRFASVWTGDNVANWEHLWLASIQTQRLAVSGYSLAGSDIGGFNDMPDGELFVRWLQLGIFHPLCRVHSIGYNDAGDEAVDEDAVAANQARGTRDQEPWSFGEPFTRIARQTIELRYRLLPALYTAAWQYSSHGTPIIRPITFLDQTDPETLHRMEEFCMGDHLLAAPVAEQGATQRQLYLPKGDWYAFRSGKHYSGKQVVGVEAGLDQIPMFVRGGAVLPLGPVMQYSDERPLDQLDLRLYYTKGQGKSQLYLDAGDGYDYTFDGYRLSTFEVQGAKRKLTLNQQLEGEFVPALAQYKVVVYGLPFKASRCRVDGKLISFLRRGATLELRVDRDFRELVIS